ncbi:hypothetical protein [Actinomadura livida]|uniref:hypothetical protein n=1 Tax=Actinomadura livida TaxID=79909 RepID=UPI001671099F|nr:hypothetical protein [Actinomadura livida]
MSGEPKGGKPEAGVAKPGTPPGAGGAPTGGPSAGGAVKPRTADEPGGHGTPHAGPETSFGGDGCRPGEECGAFPMPPGGAGGVGPGTGPEAPGAPEPLLPELPAGAPSVPAPNAPGPGEIPLPPPLTAPEQAGPARAGEGRMTLMSPTAMSEQDETDWAIVVGVALVAEIGLLWGIACVGLWRRRVTLYRAAAAEPEGALT